MSMSSRSNTPRFSVITPVYDPPAEVLRETIDSVLAQTFADWELILVDDRSPSSHVLPQLRAAARSDPRIKLVERTSNGGIVAASNDGLDQATGEFIALLDHDDTLETTALELVQAYAERHPQMDYCYSDEDLLSADGRYVFPFYKPDWSPERLRSQNYCCHFSVFRAELIRQIGGFRPGFDGSQDYDIILRATERAREVVHIPFVLYHWRQLHTSVAGDPTNKPYAYEAGRRAIQEHCDRVGIDASVELGEHLGNYRLRRRVAGDPLTSVVIPTNGSSGRVWGIERIYAVSAIESVRAHTNRPLEFVVVVDEGTSQDVVAAMERAAGKAPITFVPYARPFNFSEKINLGAIHANGSVLLLLNDDVEIITDEFLEPMLALAAENGVGAVGCKLYFADGRIQHAGHVYNGSARHIMHGRSAKEVGVGGMLVVQRECIGVTAACLAVRSEVFAEVGGMSTLLPANFNDVDFSLKLHHAGYRQIWTPHVEAYHFESATRDPTPSSAEWAVIEARWRDRWTSDPYSNPNLEINRDDWVERGLR
jgi:O-antigen biosynthesis protein